MNALALELRRGEAFQFQTVADQLIRKQVKQLFQVHSSSPAGANRRCDQREPFPYPIYVTPISQDGSALIEETIVVLGKHLSERGVDFYHETPLPHRRVIVSMEHVTGKWLGFLLDLRWCRSTRHGWYENGGRFLQVVTPPVSNMSSIQDIRIRQDTNEKDEDPPS